MKDAFKETISRIEKLMWSCISLSVILILFDPSAESIDILGTNLNLQRVFIVIPAALISLAIARRILIRNASRIVADSEYKGNLDKLSDVVEYYPVPEFMYLRFEGCGSAFEMLALSLFLYLYEAIPPLALAISWYLVQDSNLPFPDTLGIAAIVLLWLAITNTELYIRKVVKPVRKYSNTLENQTPPKRNSDAA